MATLIYVLPPSMNHGSVPYTPHIHILLPADIGFCPSQATQATSLAHLKQAHLSCLHIKKPSLTTWFHHVRDKPWNVVESETMEILSGDKVPLGENKGATD